jgi:hypothetical protein
MNVDDQELPTTEELAQKAQALKKQRDTLVTDVSALRAACTKTVTDGKDPSGRSQGEGSSFAAS